MSFLGLGGRRVVPKHTYNSLSSQASGLAQAEGVRALMPGREPASLFLN